MSVFSGLVGDNIDMKFSHVKQLKSQMILALEPVGDSIYISFSSSFFFLFMCREYIGYHDNGMKCMNG